MLLGFKPRFVDPILIGTKVHTFRNKRKNPPKIGETLHMYTGLRTKKCQKITSKEKLISKQKVWVKIIFMVKPKGYDLFELKVCVDGKLIGAVYKYGEHICFDNVEQMQKLHELVQYDGFKDYVDFAEFWINDLRAAVKKKGMINELCKFTKSMDLYHWTDLKY